MNGARQAIQQAVLSWPGVEAKPHRFGRRLRYDLMEGIGPFRSRAEAEAAEKAVAVALERRGHRVFWG